MKKKRIVLGFLIVLLGREVFAGGLWSQEKEATYKIAQGFSYFEKSNNGKRPTTWAELGQVIDLKRISTSLGLDQNSSLDQTYAFASGSFKTVNGEDGELLMARVLPAEGPEGKGSGRYIIWRDPSGNILNNWIPEDEAQDLLKQPGIKLFPPEKLSDSQTGLPTSPPPSSPDQRAEAEENSETETGSSTSLSAPAAAERQGVAAGSDSKASRLEPVSSGRWLFVGVLIVGGLTVGWLLWRRTKAG